jgi:diamine N-acetyltransferase
VVLEEVRADNWQACASLEVEHHQQRFVASVAYYLALCAYGETPWNPLAVRVEDKVVGFVMWGIDPTDESFWIGGLAIDRHHQLRGYGRSVVARLLGRAVEHERREAALSYHPENRAARSLYASKGFVETGEVADDDIVARRPLR